MNKVIFSGRVAKDITTRVTPSEKVMCNFTLAVSRPYAKEGDTKTDFFNMVAWGKTAEVIGEYCGKGSKIAVEGRLLNRDYMDKNNIKRYITEVQVEHVEFLESKKAAEERNAAEMEEQSAFSISQDTIEVPF